MKTRSLLPLTLWSLLLLAACNKGDPLPGGYHWNHNGESHYLIGEAMGKAVLELLKSKSAGRGELR